MRHTRRWSTTALLLSGLALAGCVTMDRPGADVLTKQQDELFCRQLAELRAGPESSLFRETILQGELTKCLKEREWVVTR